MPVYPSAIDLQRAPVPPGGRLAAHGPRDRIPLAAPDRRTEGPTGLGPPALGRHLLPARRRFGIGIATAHRYIREAIEVLAALAHSLADAVRPAARLASVILDGTLMSDRPDRLRHPSLRRENTSATA